MPLSNMGLGLPGSGGGGGGGGLAMNDTVPLMDLLDILGAYDDIITANQNSRYVGLCCIQLELRYT